jgi:hypothetical protein
MVSTETIQKGIHCGIELPFVFDALTDDKFTVMAADYGLAF